MKIGVLALQGDVREHVAALERAGVTSLEVTHAAEVGSIDAIVLPGGESTTIGKLLAPELLEPLRDRIAEGMPAYGTCAGLILLADRVTGDHVAPIRIGGLDVTVRRNGYGRQSDSFEADLALEGEAGSFRGVFIRAPVIEDIGGRVEVIAEHEGIPVLVKDGHLLGSSFHPEMTADDRVHRMFVQMVKEVL